MIVTKVLKISNSTAPYTYRVITNSCVSTNSLTGVLGENESKLLTFVVDDITGCTPTIDIDVVDSKGCITTQHYLLNQTCNISLSLSQSNYSFTAIASGGTGQYTYNWIFDTSKFTVTTNVDNLLVLNPIGTQQTSSITCVVTDSEGCSKTSQITFQPCIGVLSTSKADTYCTSTEYITNNIELIYTGCGTPNWNTLVLVANAGLTGIDWKYSIISTTVNSIFLQITFPIKDLAAPNVVKLNASVKNTFGISTVLLNTEIKVGINTCQQFQGTVQGISSTQRVAAGTIVGQKVIKKVSDYVISTYPLNWDSFTFIPNAGQTFYAKENVLTQVGDAFFTVNREIELHIDNTPTHDIEVISWKIADIYGTFSNIVDDIFILKNIAAPTVTNDTVCMIMNQFTAINSIFANDTDYIIASLIITQQPSHGNIVIQGDNIYFSPVTDFKGTDVFKYKVANANGIYSSEATVNITIISSGTLTNLNNIVC